jgi:putative flippase GtrA
MPRPVLKTPEASWGLRGRRDGEILRPDGQITYPWQVGEPGTEPEGRGTSVVSPPRARMAGLARNAFGREETRYLIVAGSTTVCYLGVVAALLSTGMPYMFALLAAQPIMISLAFPTYRRLIFRSNGRWQHDLPRFVGVWSGGFFAGLVVTPALVELAGQPPMLAQVIAVASVAVLSYLGHKFVSFRQ